MFRMPCCKRSGTDPNFDRLVMTDGRSECPPTPCRSPASRTARGRTDRGTARSLRSRSCRRAVRARRRRRAPDGPRRPARRSNSESGSGTRRGTFPCVGRPSGPSTSRPPGAPLFVRYSGTSNVPRTRLRMLAFGLRSTVLTWKAGTPAPSARTRRRGCAASVRRDPAGSRQ